MLKNQAKKKEQKEQEEEIEKYNTGMAGNNNESLTKNGDFLSVFFFLRGSKKNTMILPANRQI